MLPWHDPIRVAEQIALLDVISGGRTLMGFGRGADSVEYEGFRIQQIAELRRLTGMDHLVTEFSFGSMPYHLAELNMRLFAEKVLPVPQRDASFRGVIDPQAEASQAGDERLFAPA